MRSGGLVADAVDENLEQGSSVGGRLVGPNPGGESADEGAIDTGGTRWLVTGHAYVAWEFANPLQVQHPLRYP